MRGSCYWAHQVWRQGRRSRNGVRLVCRQRGPERSPFAIYPSAHETDRSDDCNEHDSEQDCVLDKRRTAFVIRKLFHQSERFSHGYFLDHVTAARANGLSGDLNAVKHQLIK